jgi:L-asparaginase
MSKTKITFIQTGGTIDKDYPRSTGGWAFEFGEPATHRILSNVETSFKYEIVTICQKDSLEINDEDRELMFRFIRDHKGKRYIITHGTDTMIDTALYLGEKIKKELVIITGAMRPERFKDSDAPLNLGCAIGGVNTLKKGVYVCMNGIIKPFDKIERDLETGMFF